MRWRLRSRSLSEAQKEAQSAAEVADRQEQIAHNKESVAQVAAEEDACKDNTVQVKIEEMVTATIIKIDDMKY